MDHSSLAGRIFRGVALALVLVFFMFPIVWIFLMSFQTNEQILRIPPRILFEPTLTNYQALISGQLRTTAGNLEISFMRNLMNSFVLSSAAVILALLLGVPAAYAFARFKFRLGESIAFHPYPQLIPSVFNLSGFAPPQPLTAASHWPWVDHPASGPGHATKKHPIRIRFRYDYPTRVNLATCR